MAASKGTMAISMLTSRARTPDQIVHRVIVKEDRSSYALFACSLDATALRDLADFAGRKYGVVPKFSIVHAIVYATEDDGPVTCFGCLSTDGSDVQIKT